MTLLPKVYLAEERREGWFESELPLYAQGQIDDNFKSINEYQSLQIRLESNDPTDTLWVQAFDSDSLTVIHPGEAYLLAKPGDSEDMLVPGDYPVVVHTNMGTYETLYRIKPKNMSWEQIFHLRSYLETKLTGLSKDLLRRKSGTYEDEHHVVTHSLKIYQHVQKHFNRLKHHIEEILEDPQQQVVQVYDTRNYSKRPDAKSLRWLSKRGMANNSNPLELSHFYEKHSRLTVETPENRWVKHILRSTRKSLKKAIQTFQALQMDLNQLLEKKQNEMLNFQQRLRLLGSSLGYDDTRNELNALISQRRKEIVQTNERLIKTDNSILELQKFIAYFSRFELHESLSGISQRLQQKKPTARLLKDSRYAYLYRFYSGIENMETKEVFNKDTVFPYKRTSLLFEYYVVCLVIESLETYGFTWINGWLADEINPISMIGSLVPDTLLTFEKEDFMIELAYDTQILETGGQDTQSYFKANKKKSPDIRLALYSKEGHFLKSIIIEVKCRHVSYLWDEIEENDVMWQLKDYLNIWHYDLNKPQKHQLDRQAVSKVVTVYPKQPSAAPFFERNDYTLAFIQLEAVDPASEDEPFGFDHLNFFVHDFLNTSIKDSI
ncbi:DUF2357 domain-containing protein [Paenibacillus agricola]|uniref:DUF2357 domain-containing protein n=1 Tax=Paenibacillus agricola TaxID=2716264 RepID=A0ABX0JK73_9BACL|nr:DUF2357 domain-containing protein [Paenibacillus agricola]NHN34406.1 DUF2357 domain-containing protein [Paenibacillus agricola]